MTVAPVPVTPPEPAPAEPAPTSPAGPGFADALQCAQEESAPKPPPAKAGTADTPTNEPAKHAPGTITDATVLALLAALTGVATPADGSAKATPTATADRAATEGAGKGESETTSSPPAPALTIETAPAAATDARGAPPAEPSKATAVAPTIPATAQHTAPPANAPALVRAPMDPAAPTNDAAPKDASPAPVPPAFVPPAVRPAEPAAPAPSTALAVTPPVPAHAEPTVANAPAVAAPAATTAPAPPPPAEQLFTVMRPLQRTPDGGYQLRLELRPPELGRIDLRVEMRDGVMHASIHAEHAHTAELVRNALDDLRARLDAGGVRAGELTVSDGGNDQREHGEPAATPNHEDIDVTDATTAPTPVGATRHTSPDNVLDVRI